MDYTHIKNKLYGPVFPIITPFTSNEKLDLVSLEAYIDFLYAHGVRIFHVMIHNSRFSLLTPDEMWQVNKTVINKVKQVDQQCLVICANPIYGPTSLSVDFAKKAHDLGADIIGLYFSERFYDDDQVVAFYETVAGSSPIGILIHEQPMLGKKGTAQEMYSRELLDRLVAIDNVVAMKEDSKNDEYTAQIIDRYRDRMNIIVSGGGKGQYFTFHPMGCQAYLVGVASFLPWLAFSFHNRLQQGDRQGAKHIIEEFEEPFFQLVAHYGWHLCLKAAMDAAGVMSAGERSPLFPLTGTAKTQVSTLAEDLKKRAESFLCDPKDILPPACGAMA